MKIVIIGRNGQLARALIAAGAPEGMRLQAISPPELDITSRESVDRALSCTRPDVVINTAAYTAVDTAESEAQAAFSLNRDGARHLAQACCRMQIPLVHISTDYVFDGKKAAPYVEEDPTCPLNVYGKSKLEGERAVRQYCQQHLILRTSWLFSPHGRNFVRAILQQAQMRDSLQVVDDQLGTPTYAAHLARGILHMLQVMRSSMDEFPWGTYHMSGAGKASWCTLAQEVLSCAARLGGPVARVQPIASAEFPSPARRPTDTRLDNGKLIKAFGIRLPDWREGTHECVRAILEGEMLT